MFRLTETDYAYDSLSRVLEETQDGMPVSSQWAGDGRRLALTYASGTALNFDFDANKRLKDITEQGSTVSHWNWIGPGMRPLQRAVENGITLSFLDSTGTQDVGWDADQRVVKMRYVNTASTNIVNLGYTYDRANNRTSETRKQDGTSDDFTYDSVYRVVNAQYNLPTAGGTSAGILGNIAENFTFDGVNNRTSVLDTLTKVVNNVNKTSTSAYTVNSTNEYVTVGTTTETHDANGNLLQDDRFCYHYDFRNLLIELDDKSTGRVVYYRFDALGRRIEKTWVKTPVDPVDPCDDDTADNDAGNVITHRFVYDGARILEKRNGSNVTKKEWLYGVGLDEPIRMTVNANNPSTKANFYYCQNAIGSVVALTDHTGAVVETYKYLAFGQEEVYSASGTQLAASAYGNPYRFQGRWRNSAEGSRLYNFRARMYDPLTGRFINRDPIGVWGDRRQFGNGYSAFGANPLNHQDPFGLYDPYGMDPMGDAPSGGDGTGWGAAFGKALAGLGEAIVNIPSAISGLADRIIGSVDGPYSTGPINTLGQWVVSTVQGAVIDPSTHVVNAMTTSDPQMQKDEVAAATVGFGQQLFIGVNLAEGLTGSGGPQGAGGGSWERNYQNPTPDPDMIPQYHKTACGAATGQNMLLDNGIRSGQPELMKGALPNGTLGAPQLATNLTNAAQAAGSNLTFTGGAPMGLTPTQVFDTFGPHIAEVFDAPSGFHYLMVESIEGGTVTIVDPVNAVRATMSVECFRRLCHGQCRG